LSSVLLQSESALSTDLPGARASRPAGIDKHDACGGNAASVATWCRRRRRYRSVRGAPRIARFGR
jgi:hypothetical protein